MTKQRLPYRVKRTLMGSLAVLLAAAVGVGGWALNRFVIDHVQISDVRAYEAQQSASAQASSSPASATTSTSTSATATEPSSPSVTSSATATASATKTATPTKSATPTTTAKPTKTAKPTTSTTVTATPTTKPSASATATASNAPVITSSSYQGNGITLKISKVSKSVPGGTLTYYVADIVLTDATKLRSAFANNQFGTNIIDLPSTIAKQNKAFFAINGDYYGFRDTGIEIRNGVIFRDSGARMGLAFYRDGTVKVYDERKTTAKALVDAGVWQTMSFGPALLVNGEIPDGIGTYEVDTNIGNHPIQGHQPRTIFGQVSSNHFMFVAIDGRHPGYSDGITMPDAATLMQSLGCKIAYNLDGGGSTTMWFNGSLVNQPSNGGERGTSDIFYLAG